MITLEARKTPDINGLTHQSTSWQIATDISFTNILEESLLDTENLTVYYSAVVLPLSTTYYARYKKYYDNGQDGGWVVIDNITNAINDDKLLFAAYDISIEAPMVTTTVSEILTSETLDIKTSSFRGVGDGHTATHWFVFDRDNNVIYAKLNDTVNKTAISIPKSELDVSDRTYIRLGAIHVTGTGMESGLGARNYTLYNFNFDIVSATKLVVPNVDYVLTVKKLNPATATNIKYINLYDATGETLLWSTPVTDPTLTEFTIPAIYMVAESDVVLSLVVLDNRDRSVYYKRMLHILPVANYKEYDNSLTITRSLKFSYEDVLGKIPTGLHSVVGYNNILPMSKSTDSSVYKVTYDTTTDKLTYTTDKFNGVSTLNTNNVNIFINYREDHRILIDTLDVDNHPTFLVYKYNVFTDSGVLLYNIPRPTEVDSMGKTNAIVRVSNYEYIYIPTNSNTIKKLNIDTGVITDVITLDMSPNTDITMLDIGNNRVMLIGGDSGTDPFYTTIYNYAANEIDRGQAIDKKFMARPLKNVKLPNNDVIVFRSTFNQSNDTDNDILYYNTEENTIELQSFNFNSNESWDVSIELNYTKTLIGTTLPASTKVYVYK